jgi:hypothetical protein
MPAGDAQSPAVGKDADHQKPAAAQSSGRIFGVMPNYGTVEGTSAVPPLSAREKFVLALRNNSDPYVYSAVGVVAGLRQQYGGGLTGYFKQYAATFTDNSSSNLLTSAALPSLLHQDPRYFERRSGSVLRRVTYAASRTAITRSDAGRPQFNFSEVGGVAIAAGLANFYYPAVDRTFTGTMSRYASQITLDTLANELREFWPDLRDRLHRGRKTGPS